MSNTHYYLVQNKEDGTTELLGLFRTFEEADDVKKDWHTDQNIPLESMTIVEKTE